ncbi:MAG: cobalamin biosynthesis protein CbiM, partial [Romboutsia sp.]
MKKMKLILVAVFLLIIFNPINSNAMHIMEGYLPMGWSIMWSVIFIPFLLIGVKSINKIFKEEPKKKVLLA